MVRMSSHKIQVRRATLEDLPKLIALWQKEFLPWETLEKRFTEFQIAETLDGELLAIAGLQASGKEGKLHSEVILRSEEGDALRAKFLERFQTLATNRGIFRIWTQLSAPFWAQNGFHPATEESMAKLPQVFLDRELPWRVLVLKDEKAAALTIEKEFEIFKEAEKERTEKVLRQARVIKGLAIMLVIVLTGIVILWAIFATKYNVFRR